MPDAIKLVAKETLASTSASVVFSNIPSDAIYHLKINARSNAGSGTQVPIYLYFNNDNTSSYKFLNYMFGNGSSMSSYFSSTLTSSISLPYASTTQNAAAGIFSGYEVVIPFPNYHSRQKRIIFYGVCPDNAATAYSVEGQGYWDKTNSITSITLTSGGSYFEVGSSFALYKVQTSNT